MGLNKSQKERAAKIFELFLSNDDNESAAAYDKLCVMGAKMSDVAVRVKGNKWRTINTGYEFEVEDNFPLLTDGKS